MHAITSYFDRAAETRIGTDVYCGEPFVVCAAGIEVDAPTFIVGGDCVDVLAKLHVNTNKSKISKQNRIVHKRNIAKTNRFQFGNVQQTKRPIKSDAYL